MSGKNAYLERQRALNQEYARVGERLGRQLTIDSMVVVLHDEFGFGYDRLKKAVDAIQEAYDTYHDAMDGGPEADYVQEKLDGAIRRAMNGKGEFFPFAARYPEIKKITYEKKR